MRRRGPDDVVAACPPGQAGLLSRCECSAWSALIGVFLGFPQDDQYSPERIEGSESELR